MGSGFSVALGLFLLTPAPPAGLRRYLAGVFTPGCISTMASGDFSQEQCLGQQHRPRLHGYVG